MRYPGMKNKLSAVFALAAVLLFGAMCAVVAYNYASLRGCASCSAPPETAFLLAIPFVLAIAVCAILAAVLRRRG